jgi:hypothetical protein
VERGYRLQRLAEADGRHFLGLTALERDYGAEVDRILSRPAAGLCPADGCVRPAHEHQVHRDGDGCEWRVDDPVDYVLRAHGRCPHARRSAPATAHVRAQTIVSPPGQPVSFTELRPSAAQLAAAEARGRAQVIDAITRAIADWPHAPWCTEDTCRCEGGPAGTIRSTVRELAGETTEGAVA